MDNDKNLMLWNQNINGSNIYSTNDGKDLTLELVPFYLDTFQNVYNDIMTHKKASFCKYWVSICNRKVARVRKHLHKLFKVNPKDDPTHLEDRIELICSKFRGNLGEIVAEYFFKTGRAAELVSSVDYNRVDPHNEKYLDATSTDSNYGNKIGIQIKNYATAIKGGHMIEILTKLKASAFDMLLHGDINYDAIKDPNNNFRPYMYLFSFTNPMDYLNWDNTAKFYDCQFSVKFLGPEYIDSKQIHNSPIFFKTILDDLYESANELRKTQKTTK